MGGPEPFVTRDATGLVGSARPGADRSVDSLLLELEHTVNNSDQPEVGLQQHAQLTNDQQPQHAQQRSVSSRSLL